MLLPSARELWPFFLHSGPRSPSPARRGSPAPLVFGRYQYHMISVRNIHNWVYILTVWRARLASCRRLAQWYEPRALTHRAGVRARSAPLTKIQKTTLTERPIGDLRRKRRRAPFVRLLYSNIDTGRHRTHATVAGESQSGRDLQGTAAAAGRWPTGGVGRWRASLERLARGRVGGPAGQRWRASGCRWVAWTVCWRLRCRPPAFACSAGFGR